MNVLSVSPHPDDELLGAPATLMALRDAGWRVANMSCSLGREADRDRRRAELVEACRLAGFELIIPEPLPPIGLTDDLALAQVALSEAIAAALDALDADLIVGPSPHDGHHAHEVVGRAILDAVEGAGKPMHVMFWGLWADLALPNVIVPFGGARLAEIRRALAAHAGELRRNRLDKLARSRAVTAAVLGPERVLGFGIQGIAEEFAELLTHVIWSPVGGWQLTAARELDSARPLAAAEGQDVGWWLHAPSVRSSLAALRSGSSPPAPSAPAP